MTSIRKLFLVVAAVMAGCSAILPDYENVDLRQSDGWMGRTVSMQIKLSWTADELEQRVERMAAVISEQM